MDTEIFRQITRCFAALESSGDKRATAYLRKNYTVKVTRLRKPSKRARYATVLVTCGCPNFRERKFIADCVKAGEPFPVKRIQTTPWPVKRRKK